jgi:hypothetical protein
MIFSMSLSGNFFFLDLSQPCSLLATRTSSRRAELIFPLLLAST